MKNDKDAERWLAAILRHVYGLVGDEDKTRDKIARQLWPHGFVFGVFFLRKDMFV